jgi:CubicO group peptidase (beta-lactamase class C family)
MRFPHILCGALPSFCGAIASFALTIATQQLRAQADAARKPDTPEAFLRHQMEARHIPGMQVAILYHDKVVLSSAYGVASLQDAIPVTTQTVFPIYSITKAFTGVAVMQLVEAGRLDLSAPVWHYLDGLPTSWQPITIRQLLTHTSGLPNILDNETGALIVPGEDAAWAKVTTMPMEFAPGEKFNYCQTNYLLIGRIIDKLSGKPFIQFISENQFKVLDMPLTQYGDGHAVIAHSSHDYFLAPAKPDAAQPLSLYRNDFVEDSPSLLTAAGLNTTAEELAQWAVAVRQGKLFHNRETVDLLWTPGRINNGSMQGFSQLFNGYAIGWPALVRPEHRAMAPIGGGRTALFVYPDDDLTIVILTNLRRANPEDFVDELASLYIPTMKTSTGFGFPSASKSLHAAVIKSGGYEHLDEVLANAEKQGRPFQLSERDWETFGVHLFAIDQKENALIVLKKNVSLHPEVAAAYDLLSAIYYQLGNTELSNQNRQRYMELKAKETKPEKP